MKRVDKSYTCFLSGYLEPDIKPNKRLYLWRRSLAWCS